MKRRQQRPAADRNAASSLVHSSCWSSVSRDRKRHKGNKRDQYAKKQKIVVPLRHSFYRIRANALGARANTLANADLITRARIPQKHSARPKSNLDFAVASSTTRCEVDGACWNGFDDLDY